ncbi:hypothetical protein GCM10017556_06110 [Micromonospora sagamiensis]|nr:hypothetical protein GCM10017556_06110 [Micromonospora sagamiensis]
MPAPDVRDRRLYLSGHTVAEAARAVGLPYTTVTELTGRVCCRSTGRVASTSGRSRSPTGSGRSSRPTPETSGLCRHALDLLGVSWRMNRRNSLSVARREAVALLDRYVGPKS